MSELYKGTLSARQTFDEGDYVWHVEVAGRDQEEMGAVDASLDGYIQLKGESPIRIFPEAHGNIAGNQLLLELDAEEIVNEGAGYYELIGNYGEYHNDGKGFKHSPTHYTFTATLAGCKPPDLWFGIRFHNLAAPGNATSKIYRIVWAYRDV